MHIYALQQILQLLALVEHNLSTRTLPELVLAANGLVSSVQCVITVDSPRFDGDSMLCSVSLTSATEATVLRDMASLRELILGLWRCRANNGEGRWTRSKMEVA